MTTQELRELDAWIFTDVLNLTLSETDEVLPEISKSNDYALDVWQIILDRGAKPTSYKGVNEVGEYKYCIMTDSVYVDADTLPIAICLFARQLFGKDSK